MATSFTKETKPTTIFVKERALLWSSGYYPWKVSEYPWLKIGTINTSFTKETKPTTAFTKETKP